MQITIQTPGRQTGAMSYEMDAAAYVDSDRDRPADATMSLGTGTRALRRLLES